MVLLIELAMHSSVHYGPNSTSAIISFIHKFYFVFSINVALDIQGLILVKFSLCQKKVMELIFVFLILKKIIA